MQIFMAVKLLKRDLHVCSINNDSVFTDEKKTIIHINMSGRMQIQIYKIPKEKYTKGEKKYPNTSKMI